MPVAWDIWYAGADSLESIRLRAERRFFELVMFARTRSPFYREWYGSLPQGGFKIGDVPPVTRDMLMERFNDWITDPDITRRSVTGFASDPGRKGRSYLGNYAVWTSSGTASEPGLFVHDGLALAVYDALDTLRFGRGALAPGFMLAELFAGGRYAMVGAIGGHYAGVASVERFRLTIPAIADRLRAFSILDPPSRLVKALNSYKPSIVATYATAASLLAREQKAGRLRIHPLIICVGGETMSAACRSEIAAAFRCPVYEIYGASECMSIACGCGQGALHLNADWVMLEPVDRNYQPVPRGEPSYTVLLTNLANRVQPIIRYDLGDTIAMDSTPCACGSPFPVIRVEGRRDETLCLHRRDGTSVDLLPLALTTLLEERAGVYRFQIVQTAPDALGVRLAVSERGQASIKWPEIARALRAYLDAHGLTTVKVHRDRKPPQRSARCGKLIRVVTESSVRRP